MAQQEGTLRTQGMTNTDRHRQDMVPEASWGLGAGQGPRFPSLETARGQELLSGQEPDWGEGTGAQP